MGCAMCLSLFCGLASVLLFFFSLLISQSITFAIIGAERRWDLAAKKAALVNAAIAYGIIALLAILVQYKKFRGVASAVQHIRWRSSVERYSLLRSDSDIEMDPAGDVTDCPARTSVRSFRFNT